MRTFSQNSLFKTIAALAMLVLLLTACMQDRHSQDAAVERIRLAITSTRFIAYTPTDLTIINGQVQPASQQQIRKDLTILRKDFQGLILYSSTDGMEAVPAIATELGFQAVILGIWYPQSEAEIASAVHLAQTYPKLVVGVAVGNEMLLAERMAWPTLRQSIRNVRAALPNFAVTTSEPFYYYLNDDPADFLVEQDFLLPSVHPLHEPWFAGASTEGAVDFVLDVAARLSAKSEKPLLLKETGLPSGPPERGFTPQRQAEFWGMLTQRMAPTRKYGLTYFEAFDHAWKVENAKAEFGHSPEEAYWGLYQEDGMPKPVLNALRKIWRADTHPQ